MHYLLDLEETTASRKRARVRAVANAVAARRLLAFMDVYGLDDGALAVEVQGRAESAMREAVAAVPDDSDRRAIGFDAVRDPLALRVAITIAGDRLQMAWQAPPQTPGGSGFGEPRERAREALLRDLQEGYATEEGADACGLPVSRPREE
jgi:N-methylhydantoinase B/oxoprolinase/acetone carboxylase alpha subunit